MNMREALGQVGAAFRVDRALIDQRQTAALVVDDSEAGRNRARVDSKNAHSGIMPSLPKPDLINLPPFGPVLRLVIRARHVFGAGDAPLGAEVLLDERCGDFVVLA